MKTILLTLIAIAILTINAPAAERDKSPGWKRLWLPVVKWDDCPVTPFKARVWRSDLNRPWCMAHPITGRY